MRIPPLLLSLLVYGCSASPQAPVTGSATVLGQVLQNSGEPLANSSVVIDCASGVASKTTPTDGEGWYGANLSAPQFGRIRCVFAVPDLVTPRIRVDTAINFGRDGQLHALQFISLREGPTP
jgi:hypothetical protein